MSRRRFRDRYDLRMITDFFEQLRCELLFGKSQLQPSPGPLDPGLADSLGRFLARYRCPLMIRRPLFPYPQLSPEDKLRAQTMLKNQLLAKYERDFQALAAAQPLLQSACACIANCRHGVEWPVPANIVLDGSYARHLWEGDEQFVQAFHSR